ncbi:MAG: hypothetical protein KBF64_08285, partial [Anaerolineaceae bacterium]|nr:hypothetical protein [Anaerolineaceae bacterium]
PIVAHSINFTLRLKTKRGVEKEIIVLSNNFELNYHIQGVMLGKTECTFTSGTDWFRLRACGILIDDGKVLMVGRNKLQV